MKNTLLSERTETDINNKVDKILVDLGNPEPPLDLQSVQQLLLLDLKYYQLGSNSGWNSAAHYIKMAGKQIVKDPIRILDAIKKCDLKALYLPKTKTIWIDEKLPVPKKRWGFAHEIGHSILPWHEVYTFGDDHTILSLRCHEKIESEANYVASQLLFL